jgi:hypothetical protein
MTRTRRGRPGTGAPEPRPLLVPLMAAACGLLAVGAVLIAVADGALTRGYLMRQAGTQLRAYTRQLTTGPLSVTPSGAWPAPGGTSPAAGRPLAVPLARPGTAGLLAEVTSPGGQVVLRAGPGTLPGPAAGQLPRRAGGPVTVAASRGGGSWLVITAAVRYRARRIPFTYGSGGFSLLVTSRARAGVPAVLVTGLELDPVTRAVHRLTAIITAAGGLLVLAVAAAGLAVARALAGWPGRVSAAGPGTARLAAELAGTCAALQRPLAVIAGAAEYYRQRGPLSAAAADRLMRRVGAESARLQAVLDGRADRSDDGWGALR